MTIRKKITLWITSAGIIASLVFSSIVFLEMREQPYKILDAELKSASKIIARLAFDRQNGPAAATGATYSEIGDYYWFKVYGPDGQLICQSDLARQLNLSANERGGKYNFSVNHLPEAAHQLLPRKEDDDELIFRVRDDTVNVNGVAYRVRVAKIIESLTEEFKELFWGIALGMLASIMVLVWISYAVAGRILKPMVRINQLAMEINEKTLDRRLPVGENRDELAVLSETLNHMFDRLQYSFQHQKQFLADASHELKTPITLLRLFTENALNHPDLPEDLVKQLNQQNEVILRIDRLIKNLLDLSALELTERLNISEFCVADLIRSVLQDFEVLIVSMDLRLGIDLPDRLPVKGDREKLRRVLVNVLDNAIKYNHKGGEIRITAKKSNGGAEMAIANTGPGIPAGEEDKIFDQFYRVEKSRSQRHGGAGLGLTIVKRIIELHGGEVAVESTPGECTKLTIRL